MGKHSLFKAPFGGVMRWLGGIPVNREQSNNLVASSAQAMRDAQGPMQLIVPPRHVHKRASTWKTGFYFIAQQACVPIVLAFADYGRKVGGAGACVRAHRRSGGRHGCHQARGVPSGRTQRSSRPEGLHENGPLALSG